MFNLVSAAAATGVNRSAIFRAIKAGRLSAQRDDNGGWEIQPCELFRVFPPLPLPTADQAMNNAIADLRNVLQRRREDYEAQNAQARNRGWLRWWGRKTP